MPARDDGCDARDATTSVAPLQGGTWLLEAVMADAPEAVFVKDLEGRYRFANPAGLKLLGLPLHEVLGRTETELFSAKYAEAQRAVEARVIATGGTEIVEAESEHGGTRRAYESTKSPLRDRGGNIVGVVTIKRDVTERRRLEAQLRRAQRLDAIGRLAGSVAHDFRNVLSGIRGFAELLVHSFAPEDPRAADTREILLATERGHEISEQLLAFSRQQPPRARPVAVDALVDGVFPLLERIGGRTIRVVRRGAAPATVHADQGQLEQVLVNLVANARDATLERLPDGGTVTVETGLDTLREPATLRSGVIPSGSYATVTVADAGLGMDQGTMERLFEPFFTTKPSGRGTGLGLATAYGVVTQAGGGIDVTSTPGAGSTFTLYLPADAGAANHAAPAEPDLSPGSARATSSPG